MEEEENKIFFTYRIDTTFVAKKQFRLLVREVLFSLANFEKVLE